MRANFLFLSGFLPIELVDKKKEFTMRSNSKARRKRKPKECMIKKEGKKRELRKIIFWMPKLEVKIGRKD